MGRKPAAKSAKPAKKAAPKKGGKKVTAKKATAPVVGGCI